MPEPWTALAPITCEIGYQDDHVGNPSFYEKTEAAQPGLVHIGHDVPISSWMGAVILHGLTDVEYLGPEDIPGRIETIGQHIRRLRRAGAPSVIPYICTMLCCGNPETRVGWWHLLDRWEAFAHLGLGEVPDGDPVDWNQSPVRPLPEDEAHRVYEPSVVAPGWRRFLRVCVDLAAQCGYDGTFLDVNAYCGTGEYDLHAFAGYISERYSEAERSDLLGFSSTGDVRFGEEEGTLLRFETLRYRAVTMGRLFAELRDVGRERGPGFWVYPNNSPLGSIDAFYKRRESGHQLRYIHEPCKYVMFEEMQQPGRFGIDRVNDHILQYRYALAHGARATVLSYHAVDEAGVVIANAECAANGGAMFVHPGFEGRGAVRFWTEWFDRHRERHDGLRSVHSVGVVFFADEMLRDNRAHIEAVYRIRQTLSDHHVLFDFLVEDGFTSEALQSFDAVVIAQVSSLSADQEGAIEAYVAGGGALLIVGGCGARDELMSRRPALLGDRIAGPRVSWVRRLDELAPPRQPELFDLTEEQINDIGCVLGLADRVDSAAEVQAARAASLIAVLEQLAGRRLRTLDDGVPYTLRVSAFADPQGGRTVVHLVNYDLPVHGIGKSGPVCSVRDVRLPFRAGKARWWTPEGVDGEALAGGDGFSVPEVRSYALMELQG